MIAVVTGGTGFLGRRLVRQLAESGADVRCLVRAGSNGAEVTRELPVNCASRVSTFIGSLEQPESLTKALTGSNVVYHVAAGMRGSVPALFLSNVIGTRALIESTNRAGVSRLVLVSSIAVHGVGHLRKNGIVDESCPLDPQPHQRDPYTFSKIEQERAAWESHHRGDIALVVVRPGVIYGPGRDCLSSRVGLKFGNILLKMGNQRLPYTYVDNCADAIHLAGIEPTAAGHSFNVVDDTAPTGNEILTKYREHGNRLHIIPIPGRLIRPVSWLCQWYHEWSRGQLPAVLTPYKSVAQWNPFHYSNAKTKRMLNWRPRIGFQEGLTRTLAWRSAIVRNH